MQRNMYLGVLVHTMCSRRSIWLTWNVSERNQCTTRKCASGVILVPMHHTEHLISTRFVVSYRKQVLAKQKLDVAKKYTKVDCKCLSKVLDLMCLAASQQPPQSNETGAGAGFKRARSNSIPEDAKLNFDGGIYPSVEHLLSLPTIASQLALLDGLILTKQ